VVFSAPREMSSDRIIQEKKSEGEEDGDDEKKTLR